jgi:hypothetical protein
MWLVLPLEKPIFIGLNSTLSLTAKYHLQYQVTVPATKTKNIYIFPIPLYQEDKSNLTKET